MTPEVDRTLHVLPEQENERIFRKRVVPDTLAGTAQSRPVVVFVAGQTGAGKTALTKLVEDALARSGQAVNLNLDTYKPYHPRYDELLVADDTTVGAYTSIDGHKWMEKAEAYAIESRFNVLMESAMRDPRDFEEPAARFRAAGYRVEAAVLAVHESDSRLGALERYLNQVHDFGRGRLIDEQIHDACYRGVIRSAESIDADRLADSVFVLRRDADVVYRNHLNREGQWIGQPDTAHAIAAERDRPRTGEETYQFAYGVRRTDTLIAALPAPDRGAPAAELETVLALARPLLHPDADVERITSRMAGSEHDAQAEATSPDVSGSPPRPLVKNLESAGPNEQQDQYPRDAADVEKGLEHAEDPDQAKSAVPSAASATTIEQAAQAAREARETLAKLEAQGQARQAQQRAEAEAHERADRDADYDQHREADRDDPSFDR